VHFKIIFNSNQEKKDFFFASFDVSTPKVSKQREKSQIHIIVVDDTRFCVAGNVENAILKYFRNKSWGKIIIFCKSKPLNCSTRILRLIRIIECLTDRMEFISWRFERIAELALTTLDCIWHIWHHLVETGTKNVEMNLNHQKINLLQ